MKTRIILSCLLGWIPMLWLCAQSDVKEAYLRKVLANLETIKSATYYIDGEAYQPGDTVPLFIYKRYLKEYNFPADSTIGAIYTEFEGNDTTQYSFGYNGEVRLLVYSKEKEVAVDDFTSRPLPFRPVIPPFFNYVTNIIKYALETKDHITTTLTDVGDQYHFKLVIEEDTQVEFFGKAIHMPKSPFCTDPTSIYEIWIRKSDDLPYKRRREMSHDVSVAMCSDVKFNQLSLEDLDLFRYIPEDYQIEKYQYGKKKEVDATSLIGKPAPSWTLCNVKGSPVALSDVKGKVILLNFTGIGCGACQAAVPFLKELKSKYAEKDFEIVAIESWSRTPRSLQIYSDRKQLNYPVLGATDQVLVDYQTGGAAPYFFFLDEQRVIRKVIRGYSERLNEEMTEAVEDLIKH